MLLPTPEAGLDAIRQELLGLARQGEALAREKLLEMHRYFIQRLASSFCCRHLEWGRDDELSIVLLAFNEAIDRYREERGVPFLVYARRVIKTRLIDFQRQERRRAEHEVSFDSAESSTGYELAESKLAWEKYNEEVLVRERAAELVQYENLLIAYGLSLAELVRASPKHKDTRSLLINAARRLVGEPLLFAYLEEKKKLPVQELARLTGLSVKTVERGRKYIVAVSLILGYPEKFSYLNSYLLI